ncbi:MAG: glycosyl transferase family 1 [Paenibacillaceae bacterium]|nr:glycosyl transferase family 1 [Paenibacillaceae bacterium]
MVRVLFINGGSEGHINPTVGVVQELVSRGAEVVYVCIEAFRERMEKAGASVRTFDGQAFIRAFVSGGRNHMLERINGLLLTADIVIPRVLEQIEGERFDCIVHDSMFGCGRLLARLLKLPAIGSCTSFAQNEASFKRMMESLDTSVPAGVAGPIRERFQSLAAAVENKYGVAVGSPYEVFCNPAPLTLVYTTREFQPDGETFDETYRFVGPSVSPRFTPQSFDFPAIEGKRPIYISLGTVFNHAIDFYKLCIEAFGSTAHTVVMAIGNKVALSDLGEVPGNFIVQPYVPQTELLPLALLFLTHGGMNSVHEGLYNGVPLVVIPQSADQPLIAERVARIGAGIRLSMPGLTAARLRDAANEVLGSPSYSEAAAAIGETFRTAGGYRLAVDEIMAYIGRSAAK